MLLLGNTSCSEGKAEREEGPQIAIEADTSKGSLPPLAETESTKTAARDSISIIGVGDMMFGTNYPSANYLPPNEGKDLLNDVAAVLKAADITFGNLEGTVLDEGGEVKKCGDPSKCYAFRSPEKYAEYNLLAGGFDMVSIANNHVGDFGNTGRDNTIAFLDRIGVAAAGLLQLPTTIVEKEGIKYGLAAFAPNYGTVDIRDIEGAKKIVAQLKQEADIVIVSFHGGAEGRGHQHVTRKTETFYGENRGNVHAFSHAVIDAGADIVFGHGPHVTRAIELYKDRFIAYSLGNFCTYGRFSLKGESGLAPIMDVRVNEKGEFLSAQATAIKQIGAGIPIIDKDKAVIKILQNLTAKDFPESVLLIDDNGYITKKKD
ncbi:MAG: CapA family protein [Bernardetiaceae bacterium]|nr:CapA family protein [Bernardetiaceae bacterium]